MPGKKLWNSDLDLKGKAIINTVPNAMGTVLTYPSGSKEVSTRSNSEFINDLSLMTTNTVQQVTAQKQFVNVDFPFQFRYAGTKSWTLQKVATGNSLAFLPSTTVNGTDVDTNNWIGLNDNGTVYTSGVYKRNSNDGYFLLGGSGHMLTTAKEDSFKTSIRNANGILITTDLDYSQTQGAAWLLELKGNMYGGGIPLVATIQGYVYNDTMINVGGVTTVDYFNSILVTNLGGKICFWFPKFFYWQGFSARMLDVTSAGGAAVKNHVMSIEEFTMDPGGTKRVNIPITVLSNSTNGWTGLPNFLTWSGHGAITERKVIGEMAWKYYGNGHTIVDVSSGFAPDGTPVSKENSQIAWGPQYPMLVGWNGVATYGLKVDTARRAEELGNYGAQNYVTVFQDQEIYGLKRFTQRFKNTGTGWGNNQVTTEQSILFDTGNGPDGNNWSTFSMGFFSTGTSVQAGIYVRSNSSAGTEMAFATTNSFASGPQLAMTINTLGTVDFPRANPTVSGNMIFHRGAAIDYNYGLADVMLVGTSAYAQRRLLSLTWDGVLGDQVVFRVPGVTANTTTMKLAQNGNGYIGDKKILTETDFNPASYVQSWEGATALGFSNGNPQNLPYIFSNIDNVYHFLGTTAWIGDNFLSKAGGTLTGEGRIDSRGNITIQQLGNGGNVTGLFWEDMNNTAIISGIGTLTGSGLYEKSYIGWGASPWDSATNLTVSPSAFTYKDLTIWHAGNLTYPMINSWNNAANKFISTYAKDTYDKGDRHRFTRNDGTVYEVNSLGLGVFDTRYGELGNTTGNPTYIPPSSRPELNHKLTPLFHTFHAYQFEWASSLITKGWNDAYRAWRIIGPASIDDTERDFYLSQTKASDGNWLNDRMIWTSKHFSQTNVDQWNAMSGGGIVVNQDFSAPFAGNQVGITSDYFGGESGLWDFQYDTAIAVKWGSADYLYGGSAGSFDGMSWNVTTGHIGMGKQATNTKDKVQVKGGISVETTDINSSVTQLILDPLHTYNSDISQSRNAHIYVVTRDNVILPDHPIFGQRIEIYNFGTIPIDVRHNNTGTLFTIPGESRSMGIATQKGFMFDRDPVIVRRYDV